MIKTFTVLSVVAIASGQFLNRDLQTTTMKSPFNITSATTFSTACTASINGTTDSCTAELHCCGSLKRGTAAVATAASVCIPFWVSDVAFNVSGVVNTRTFINSVNKNAWFKLPSSAGKGACLDNADCGVGLCCANFTHSFGPAAAPGAITRQFCNDGTQDGLHVWSAYPAAITTVATEVKGVQSSCINNVATSFGAYIKASAMIVMVLLSVSLF